MPDLFDGHNPLLDGTDPLNEGLPGVPDDLFELDPLSPEVSEKVQTTGAAVLDLGASKTSDITSVGRAAEQPTDMMPSHQNSPAERLGNDQRQMLIDEKRRLVEQRNDERDKGEARDRQEIIRFGERIREINETLSADAELGRQQRRDERSALIARRHKRMERLGLN